MEKNGLEMYCGGTIVEYKIITDLRILKKFEKKYNMKFDRDFKYCTESGIFENDYYNVDGHRLKYFDGCFYPYLVRNISFTE